MALIVFMAILAIFFNPISAIDISLPPSLSPLLDKACNETNCGKGDCKVALNRPFGFVCECNPGWKHLHTNDTDEDLWFLPCVIPDCALDYSCMETIAPAPLPSPLIKHLSFFDPCAWAYCAEGTCMNSSDFGHRCNCGEGYANLLNISFYPCYKQCALGLDCARLGINVLNETSPSNSGSPDGEGARSCGTSANLLWLIISTVSVAIISMGFT